MTTTARHSELRDLASTLDATTATCPRRYRALAPPPPAPSLAALRGSLGMPKSP
jgi:hypothetical protein